MMEVSMKREISWWNQKHLRWQHLPSFWVRGIVKEQRLSSCSCSTCWSWSGAVCHQGVLFRDTAEISLAKSSKGLVHGACSFSWADHAPHCAMLKLPGREAGVQQGTREERARRHDADVESAFQVAELEPGGGDQDHGNCTVATWLHWHERNHATVCSSLCGGNPRDYPVWEEAAVSPQQAQRCVCFWGLKAVPGSQLLFHIFTASSSQQLHLPRWHLLCCSPASQMLAFRRCPGGQPCSVLPAVEGPARLPTGMHGECDLCPASSLSASSAAPWPSSTQPPGKGRRHEKLPEDEHGNADSFMALWWHWLSGAISKTEFWAVQSPTGRVKATPNAWQWHSWILAMVSCINLCFISDTAR